MPFGSSPSRGRRISACEQAAGFLAIVVALQTSACVHRDDTIEVVSRGGAHTSLTTTLASHVSMFGELPGTADSEYIARTAVSLGQHTFTEVGVDFDPDLAPTGQRLAFASTRHNLRPDLYLKAVDGTAVTQLTSDAASDIQPAISPDGTRVAFASNRGGNWDIWIVPVEGGPPVQMTRDLSHDVSPSWSPDGRELVFCSLPANGGQWELRIADAAAGSTKRFIGYGLFPEWAPVGDRILYQRARERGSRWFSVWTLTLVDGEPRYPTEIASSAREAMILPTWSPDGTRIAYVSTPVPLPVATGVTPSADMVSVSDIWLMGADGRARIRLTDGHSANFSPVFSSSGRLFFASRRSGQENIWSLSVGRGPAERSIAGNQHTERVRTVRDHSTPVGTTAGDDGL